MHKLWARFGHLVQEIGKFGVVGGIAFVVDFSIYAFCLQGLGMETLTAKAIAASIAATLAFFGNRFWTWRHRERSGLAREYGLYFFFNLVGIGVALGTLALTHYGLGSVWPIFQTEAADYISAQFLGTALGTLVRFWSYRTFVFVATTPPPVPAESTERD
ncbi:putative flippase GtrA [Catenuloplanes nepalensis]|uniref:Flippase GtrA n=1 Tax=Catenuloplanes nepalensis TaxID=587533 RepID=A0ABT9N253_9ACTN|nr:GtrA family protein [Catenuloplanes nepalensis]MDP9797756.1 putative flippase GtrA [Catenuloplanes nepalensis]